MPEPEALARIIDRACELAQEALGHAPDRREIAEKTMEWVRALGPLAERLR